MERQYRIGFSNIAEKMPAAAYRRETLETAASQYANVELVLRDNDLDDEKALANVKEFADIPVDLAIIFHVNERIGGTLRSVLLPKRIPIICVDNPIQLTTYFGADNKQAGSLAGEALGAWIQSHWQSQLDKVLVTTDARLISVTRDRTKYALTGLDSVVGINSDDVLHLDTQSDRGIAYERALEWLEYWRNYPHIAVIGVNDESALGVVDAARALEMSDQIVAVGQGAGPEAFQEFEQPNPRLIATVDFVMDEYGPRLMELAMKILNGEPVKPNNYIEHTCITLEAYLSRR